MTKCRAGFASESEMCHRCLPASLILYNIVLLNVFLFQILPMFDKRIIGKILLKPNREKFGAA